MSPVDPLTLMRQLVATDSTNPGAGEAAIAGFINDLALGWGFELGE